MVEVFKTDIVDEDRVKVLMDLIHHAFSDLQANFDLEDCDKVLRVEAADGIIEPFTIIEFLQRFGVTAEVLPDTVPMQIQENY